VRPLPRRQPARMRADQAQAVLGSHMHEPGIRPAYPNLAGGVIAALTVAAERAMAAGVSPDRIVIDPAHDFGKNTWHSLELTRRTADLAATGWPVHDVAAAREALAAVTRLRAEPSALSPG